MYELSHELPNNLTLSMFGSKDILENIKIQNLVETSLVSSPPSRNKNISIALDNWTKLLSMKVSRYLIS